MTLIRASLTDDQLTFERIAIGAAILGAGGGGNPLRGRLQALLHLQRVYRLRVVKLDELADDALVVPLGSGANVREVALKRARGLAPGL